jgi:hypothetical protein
LWIIIYIDDFLYFGTNDKTRKQFELEFGSRFNIEFQGQAHWYLAARITQDKDMNTTIDQSRYAKSIVRRYLDTAGVKKSTREVTSILPITFVPTKKDCADTPENSSLLQTEYNLDYASCVGSLIYLSNTRPDLTFGINKLAKYSRQPGERQILALIHMLKYLSYNTQLGLTYYSDITKAPVYKMLKDNNITPKRKMFTFSDSSWDDDHDTSRSTGGYLIFYQGGVIDHSSNLPIPIAMSSAEAEYNQCCLACMATGNMHMTLNHVEGIEEGSAQDHPIDIFMDNKSAVDMSVTFKDTKNSRHIRRRFHFVKQGTEENWHCLTWISNEFMLADVMTKILQKGALWAQLKWFMKSNCPE